MSTLNRSLDGVFESKPQLSSKQLFGLNAANTRVQQGTANKADIDNLNHAYDVYGFKPSGTPATNQGGGAIYSQRSSRQSPQMIGDQVTTPQTSFSASGNQQNMASIIQPGSAQPNIPSGNQQPNNFSGNPADAFNSLLIDTLKQAQGVDTAELLKRRRALQRAQAGQTQEITPEELRTLSPAQQNSIRAGKSGQYRADLDENAYQIKKAETAIANFENVYMQASKFNQEFAEKMVAPDSVIEGYKSVIEADPSKLSTLLSTVNEKTAQKIVASLDYTKLTPKQKDPVLSITEAQSLGVPFGTTLSQASQLGIIPSDNKNIEQETILDLINKYPDAGIQINDNLVTAQSKLQNSKLYKQATRLSGGTRGTGGGTGGGTRQTQKDVDAENKEIREFRKQAADLIIQLENKDVTWKTAVDILKLYSRASEDTINDALGGGIPYDPVTRQYDTEGAFGRATIQ